MQRTKIFLDYLIRVPRGRISRKNYFFGILLFAILSFIGLLLPSIIVDYLPPVLVVYFILTLYYSIFFLAAFFYFFSLHIRRLHDMGFSGWWMLLGSFPVLFSGQKSTNKYGEIPSQSFFKAIFNIS